MHGTGKRSGCVDRHIGRIGAGSSSGVLPCIAGLEGTGRDWTVRRITTDYDGDSTEGETCPVLLAHLHTLDQAEGAQPRREFPRPSVGRAPCAMFSPIRQ